MDYINLLNDKSVTTFFLLFIRWSALLTFLPIFNSSTIPNKIKATFVIWLTFVTYPMVQQIRFEPTLTTIFLSILNEVTFGFFTGIALQMIFMLLEFAGELISFVMGLTMANILDPTTGKQTPVISQFFNIVAITIFLVLNGHHLVLLLIAKSLHSMPFGEFFHMRNMAEYLIKEMGNYFRLGFSLAFPILAISILSDVIFGMIMKSMPQFNLLVVGFPIKIGLSFMIIIAILGSMIFMFRKEIFKVLEILNSFI